MGLKWDPVEKAWIPDDFLDTRGNKRVPTWRREPSLTWDVNSQPKGIPNGWGDTIEDHIKYKEAQVSPDRRGPRLMQRFRFRDAQHEADRQDAIWQRTTDAKITGRFKIADDGPIRLGAQDTYKHFRGISQAELATNNFTRPVSFIDIETGNNDQVISVSVIKGVTDKRTGEFRVLDTLERYYTPEKTYTQSFNMSREVHHLTPERIAALRSLQGNSYTNKYNQAEANQLMKFLHGSLVVGHNVEMFDFSRLGLSSRLQGEDILDTMVWAENAGAPRGKRGLEPVFKHLTGRSLGAAGYSHHFGFHDVLSNAEMYAAAWRNKGKAGRDLRYVATHPGYSYGAFEPAAGTAIIKGGYYMGRGPRGLENYMYEDGFDERGVFEYDYDENGRRKLPDGFSEEEANGWTSPEEIGYNSANYAKLVSDDVWRGFTEKFQEMKESMEGYKLGQKNAIIRYIASKDAVTAKKYLRGLGYSDDIVADFLRKSEPLRAAREQKEYRAKVAAEVHGRERVSDLLDSMYRRGEITEDSYNWFKDVNRQGSSYSSRDIAYMAREARDELKNRRKAVEIEKRQQEAYEFDEMKSLVRDTNEMPGWNYGSFDRDAAYRKGRYLDRMERKGMITESQRSALDLVDSYDDLVDATEQVIEANERLTKTYQTLASIKPYDMNQLIGAAEGQWSGIKGAARGVIPDFIRNPLSRLGDAAFNSIHRSMAPWNAAGRIWNSVAGGFFGGGGSGIGGAGGAVSGDMLKARAGLGIFNAGTQVVGNVAQAKVEMFGYGLQNNLNTLGAMISWLSTPFQLLHKALKLAIGSLGGFTFKINSFMGSGISLMSQMGNPLTNLTGVDYSAYSGTTMMDVASLFNKGTVNKSIESMAAQQQLFYSMGQVDTNRLIASSLLGVYGDVYTPNQDPHQQYISMANKLVAEMKNNPSSKSRIMALAPLISDELASLIQTASLLDVDDISVLEDPSKRGMYWNPIHGAEARNFRWTQYEYNASKDQFGTSKMRLANTLWNAGGKQIYSSMNALVDAAATGNWAGVLDQATQMWVTFRDRIKEIWGGLKDAFEQDGGNNDIVNTIKAIGLSVENVLISAAQKIVSVWDQIFLSILDKAQGLIAYLSTIEIEPHIGKDGKLLSFSINSIGSQSANEGSKIFDHYMSQGSAQIRGPNKGMSGIAALYDTLFPYASSEDKRKATIGDITAEMARLHEAGMPVLGVSDVTGGIIDYIGTDEAGAAALVDFLVRRDSKGQGFREAAAAYMLPNIYNLTANKKAAYEKMGILPTAEQLIGDTENIMNTVLEGIKNENKATIELLFRDTTGKKAMLGGDSDGNVFMENMTLIQEMLPKGTSLVVNKLRGN